jgi:uncharacterized repeat protein (TIGR02543 family)
VITKTFTQWQALPQDATGSLNPTTTYVLTVNVTGCPGSRVTSFPVGIDVTVGGSNSDTGTFNAGDVVTLTETLGSGCSFVGWTGAGSGSATASTRQVTMSGNLTVTATFAANPPPFTWPAPAFTSQLGTKDSWLGDIILGYGPIFSPPAPTTHVLTVNATGCDGSTVTSSPTGITVVAPGSDTGTFNEGDAITLLATPGTNCEFTGWSGDVTGTAASIIVTMGGNRSVTATFASIPPPPPPTTLYTLTVDVNAAGTGCTNARVTSSPTGIDVTANNTGSFDFGEGVEVTLFEAPGTNCGFSSWIGDGSGGATDTTRLVVMDTDHSVIANFATPAPVVIKHTLTVEATSTGGCASAHVTSSPSGIAVTVGNIDTYDFDEGTLVTLTEVASTGCLFDSWTGDGATVTGAPNQRQVTMDMDYSVTANFVPVAPIAAGPSGSKHESYVGPVT